jgi:hypothetical protein
MRKFVYSQNWCIGVIFLPENRTILIILKFDCSSLACEWKRNTESVGSENDQMTKEIVLE